MITKHSQRKNFSHDNETELKIKRVGDFADDSTFNRKKTEKKHRNRSEKDGWKGTYLRINATTVTTRISW
jgi:hypothetical protein